MVTLTPAGARAQRADLQLNYDQLRIRGRALRPDGSSVDTTFTRSFWVQTWRAMGTRRIRDALDLTLLGQYTRQAALGGREERTETPYGQARLSHPSFGVTATYRPSTVVQQVQALGGGGGFVDTAQTRRLEYQTRETILSGYLLPQRLPRLDVSWIRRSADATLFSPASAQEQRTARTTWSAGGVNLRAGYADLARGLRSSSVGSPIQRTYEAGAGYAFAPAPRLGVSVGYDFTRFDRDPPGAFRSRSDGHAATLGATFRQARTFDWGLGYQARYVEQDAIRRVVSRDQEGALTASWHPQPNYGAQASAGVRTNRYRSGERLQRYGSAQASAQGALRRGWTLAASAGQSVTWDPGYAALWTSHGRAGTQMRVRRGLDLMADVTASLDNDSLSDGRLTTAWSLGAHLSPWRSFTGRASVREARTGSRLGIAGTNSRAWNADVRWTPARSIDMLGALDRTQSAGGGGGALTRSASLRWTASPRFQLSGTYSRSSADYRNALVSASSGREVVTLRADWALFRHGSVSSGVAYVDPGTSRETRQFNASWNQKLWR